MPAVFLFQNIISSAKDFAFRHIVMIFLRHVISSHTLIKLEDKKPTTPVTVTQLFRDISLYDEINRHEMN